MKEKEKKERKPMSKKAKRILVVIGYTFLGLLVSYLIYTGGQLRG